MSPERAVYRMGRRPGSSPTHTAKQSGLQQSQFASGRNRFACSFGGYRLVYNAKLPFPMRRRTSK